MNQILKISLAAVFLLSACAPKVQNREYPIPKTNFGPRSEDTDLSKDLKPSDKINAKMTWQGTISTADLFTQAENLIKLGQVTGRREFSEMGLSWIKNFYSQHVATDFSQLGVAPYWGLSAAQTKEEVLENLNAVLIEMADARPMLQEHILALGSGAQTPTKGGTLFEVIAIARNFIALILATLDQVPMSDQIRDALAAELKAQTTPMFDQITVLARKFYDQQTLSRSLSVLDEVLTAFKVELDPETDKSLRDGRLIGQSLDAMRDSQGALTAIVDVWRTLDPKDRAENFKSANETLYNFMTKQNEDDLTCLRTRGCNGGFFQGIKKKVFILPKLEDYGIGKLHKELTRKSLEYVILRVETFAKDFLKEMPASVALEIDKGLVAKAAQLQGAVDDYAGTLQKLFNRWGDHNLTESKGMIPGFEANSVNIDISSKADAVITPMGDKKSVEARTVAASLSAQAVLLESAPSAEPWAIRAALSHVNKLVSIGGYRKADGVLVPGLLAPVENVSEYLDLLNMSENKISYRIPDQLPMKDAFHPEMNYAKNFSAAAYAEQIRGLSSSLRVMADWKQSGFDRALGHIKAQDLTSEVASPALEQNLYPKQQLYALTVGDIAVLLQDITKKATPVFLLTLNKKTIWADQFDKLADDETAIMAGVVDIKDGKRSNIVHAQDIAKFAMAIGEVLQATDGVENTKSEILLQKDENGKRPIDSLIEGRKDMKLLLVAMANMISSQMMNSKHLVQARYYLLQKEAANDPEHLVEEQVIAIRAMIKAYEVTGIKNYLFTAQEIFFAMNKHMFDFEAGFYVNGSGEELDFPRKVQTLLALQELKPYLAVESQAQIDRVSKPWINSLLSLK
jgi:hypothetical protein